MIVQFLVSAISVGIAFLYGCVGEILTEKSGHLNLGIPGIMCVGAVGGCWGVSVYMGSLNKPSDANMILLLLCSLLCCVLFAGALGLLYCFLTVSLRSNQNVTGLAITTFGIGFTNYFIKVVDKTYFARASRLIKTSLPLKDIPYIGPILLSHGFLVYFGIAIAIISAFVLKRTRIGLNLRSVGENPATADAVGINVTKYRYLATIIGSSIAGIGGFYYIMDYLTGMWEYNIDSIGWIAIALVIFTLWRPDLSILGSIIFGALNIAGSYIVGLNFSQKELFELLPYVVTVVVLIITSVLNSKENQPPAALGLNYFREDR